MTLRHLSHPDDTVQVTLPRSALTIVDAPPEWISQSTVERALGIPRRAYLALLPGYRAAGGEVLATGKLRLVRREDLVAWLRRRGGAKVGSPADVDDDVTDLERELGLAPVGRAP